VRRLLVHSNPNIETSDQRAAAHGELLGVNSRCVVNREPCKTGFLPQKDSQLNFTGAATEHGPTLPVCSGGGTDMEFGNKWAMNAVVLPTRSIVRDVRGVKPYFENEDRSLPFSPLSS
jgi:hypothetical protein